MQNINFIEQECIPVGCVPPACWPDPVVSRGGSAQAPPRWTERMTYAWENITLPQTSFASGKNVTKDLMCLFAETRIWRR